MPFLPSIPRDAKVPHVLALFPKEGSRAGKPLIALHEALLREESPFTIPQREMMAAFVSGVNACEYCYGAHTASAKEFGVPEALIVDLVADVDSADIDDKMKPVMRFLKKLVLTPTKLTESDTRAMLDTGWSERAVYDAVLVGCLYSFMNRYTNGLGLTPIPEQFEMEGKLIWRAFERLATLCAASNAGTIAPDAGRRARPSSTSSRRFRIRPSR